jgi:hypothetical protein
VAGDLVQGRGVAVSEEIRDLARHYVSARETHSGAARESLQRCIDAVQTGRSNDDDQWTDGEVFAPDGIALSSRCEMPDGSIRYRKNMPTFIKYQRAERNLKQALAAVGDSDNSVVVAARAVFADEREPFYSCQFDENGVLDPVQKARMNERMARHFAVFAKLKEVLL